MITDPITIYRITTEFDRPREYRSRKAQKSVRYGDRRRVSAIIKAVKNWNTQQDNNAKRFGIVPNYQSIRIDEAIVDSFTNVTKDFVTANSEEISF